jgi:hypothetical protein
LQSLPFSFLLPRAYLLIQHDMAYTCGSASLRLGRLIVCHCLDFPGTPEDETLHPYTSIPLPVTAPPHT